MPQEPADPGTSHRRSGTGPDRRAVARAFRKVAATYTASDFLHAEVRSRLLQRLDLVRLVPATVLDLGAGPPEATADAARRFPAADFIALDLVPEMLGTAPRPWLRVCADGAKLPLAGGSIDLVAASMVLHWCHDAPAVLAEVRRVLRFPGLFIFATLGPQTLKEFRSAWPRNDGHGHTIAFTDMHNIGDALIHAGFVEPVVDAEALTVTYSDLARLVADLRAVGATNPAMDRHRGLTGPGRWTAMASAYEKLRTGSGVLPVTMEVIYGQAWTGERKRDRAAVPGEVAVPIDSLRHRDPPVR